MNEDQHLARRLLDGSQYTCVLCRAGAVHTSDARGVRPLLELVGGDWAGYSAADKVVGKATAILNVLLGVRAVDAGVASEAAGRILCAHGIAITARESVPAIFNRTRTGFCPMETAVRDIEDPAEALLAIRETYDKLHR